ncbi:MAG: glycosyl transferase family protein [Rhodocyclaceae bacterium]|nr:MAG: glycosyl transferase family protein [Rhodocyclaceae bacterium]TND05565.1 MAG: glycosyl transferase family protein [Rhodocyclaceae bacterium]
MEAFWMPAIALILTLVVLHLLLDRGWAGRLAMDKPNARSLHTSPVPRVGGLVLVPAALVVSLLSPQSDGLMLAIAAGLCAISFVDDRWGLPIVLRLSSHALAAIALCSGLQPSLSPLAFGFAVIALVWAINLYNFMDGTDGLAGGMALFGFAVLGWAMPNVMPGLVNLSFCLVAAAIGFLVFNFFPARVFMGDAGAVPLGFLAGAVGLTGWLQHAWPIWFPLLVFSPFVVDASATLLKRMLRGERFWQAHRDHYYQRLVRMGWSHRRLALGEYALMAGAGVSALLIRDLDVVLQWTALAAWAVIYLAAMAAVDRRWKRFLVDGQALK